MAAQVKMLLHDIANNKTESMSMKKNGINKMRIHEEKDYREVTLSH